MQTGHFHLQNYKEMPEPQKEIYLLIGCKEMATKIDPCERAEILVLTSLCVVYTDVLPAISQVRMNIRQSFITKIIS